METVCDRPFIAATLVRSDRTMVSKIGTTEDQVKAARTLAEMHAYWLDPDHVFNDIERLKECIRSRSLDEFVVYNFAEVVPDAIERLALVQILAEYEVHVLAAKDGINTRARLDDLDLNGLVERCKLAARGDSQ